MTRKEPTPAEIKLETILLDHIRADGHPNAKVLERETADKPDFAFTSDERKIACECTQIPPSDVFQWIHRTVEADRADGGYCWAVVWADEPHALVRDAIQRKKGKIPEYRESVSADEVWLLIHTPTEATNFFEPSSGDNTEGALKAGASAEAHEFDRILFWDAKSGLRQIHARGDTPWKVTIDFSKGYPTRSRAHFGFPFTTTQKDEPRKEYGYKPIRPLVIFVPPLDPDYAKHPPSYRGRSYQITIDAGATDANNKIKIIWDDEAVPDWSADQN